MQKEETKVIFGGWYQRTTLHLTEIYDFLLKAESKLELPSEKLKSFHKKLNLKSVTKQAGYLEYVHAITNSGIEIKYYEDGLYVLEKKSNEIKKTSKEITDYFENNLNPAMNYIFSLGAPTPKILSNIKDKHRILIGKAHPMHSKFKIPKEFGELYTKTNSRNSSMYKTKEYTFVLTSPSQKENLNSLIEMQIFFREFKGQLHKYLNIHRKVWEEISEIKERKYIKGKEIAEYRKKLDSYKKTIELIKSRINQMGAYAHTRASLSKNLKIEENLIKLFQYRFEDLFNTLSYIKEIWSMTNNYVNSAIQILVELDSKVTRSGIKSIQILASIGVVTGVIRYLQTDTLPTISQTGAIYLIVLGVFGFGVDYVLKRMSKNKKYEVKFTERAKKI